MADQKTKKLGPDNEAHNMYVLCWLFVVTLACAVLRSVGTFDAPLDWQNPTDSALATSLVIGIGLPALWIAQSPGRAGYFLGASPALGVFPSLSHVPFFQEFTHLMLLTAAVAYWRAGQRRPTSATVTAPVLLYAIFAALSIASVLLNYFMHESVWQLKVGISGLFAVVTFAWLLVGISSLSPHGRPPANDILKGFLHASIGATLLGVVAVFLLFVTPYSSGTNTIGNNTIYGLGYYDRMQLLFEGPSFAGMYFVIVAGLAMYAMSRNIGVKRWLLIVILQLAPWLIMASGSRVARISLVLVLLTGLLAPTLRRTTLFLLPSAAIALLVAVNFQSLPSAVMYSLKKVDLASMQHGLEVRLPYLDSRLATSVPASGLSADELRLLSIKGRFFVDHERTALLKDSIDFFFSSSSLVQWIGNGYGVAGFRESVIPSPHQQPLDLLIEVGVLGFVIYYLFLLSSLAVLLRAKTKDWMAQKPLHYMLAILFISIGGLSLAYETGTRGITLVVIALLLASSIHRISGGGQAATEIKQCDHDQRERPKEDEFN